MEYDYLRTSEFRQISNTEAIELRSNGKSSDLFKGAAKLAFAMGFNFARRRNLQKDDYISIANIAVLEGISSWNPERFKFDHYFSIRIKRALLEQFGNNSIVRVPRPTWFDLSRIRKSLDKNPNLSVSELSVLLGKNKERILELLDLREILRIRKSAESFDRSYKSTRKHNCMEIAPNIYPCFAEVENLLKFVDNKERKELFVLKYGLLGNKIHSYTELTEKTCYSKDYIRYQIVLCIKELAELVSPSQKIIKKCQVCDNSFTPKIGRENRQNTCGDKRCANVLCKRRQKLRGKTKNAANETIIQ